MVLIASVPGHCLSFTFRKTFVCMLKDGFNVIHKESLLYSSLKWLRFGKADGFILTKYKIGVIKMGVTQGALLRPKRPYQNK